ncbi:MAG: FAD-binding oxidoreductase [Pseudomonadota bacterium]
MDEPVTIIGAGIVGICCALSLLERGVKVRLIDRGEPGQETSFGNAGVISPWSIVPQSVPGIWKSIPNMLFSGSGPLSVRPSYWPKMIPWGLKFLAKSSEAQTRAAADAMELLCQPSVMLYKRHLQGTGHENLVVDSFYVHAFRNRQKADLNELGYAIRAEKGANMELVGSDILGDIEPALSPEFTAAILIKGQARAVSPGRIGKVLANKARQLGAEFITADVRALKDLGPKGWQIATSNELVHTKTVVMAAGIWSADLLQSIGLKLPLVAERGYHVEFPNTSIALNNSIMDVDAKIVASSMQGGVRVAGSSEFGAIDAPPDPAKKALLARQSKAMFPELDLKEMTFWMGRRPSFPDSLPALGPIKNNRGLFAAFGHSHYGLMMAPKSGELIADCVTGVRSNIDLSPFDSERF